MAITTYSELQTAVANWLARDDLTAYITDFITLAETRIYRGADGPLRLRAMESSADLTISAQTVAIPTGYLGTRRLYLNTSAKKPLKYVTPDVLWDSYTDSGTGEPAAFTVEGTNFVFGPSPDATYTGKLLYWTKFTALSDANTSNWLLENAPDALLYGALLETAPFVGDDARMATWGEMFDKAMMAITRGDSEFWSYGGPLMAQPGYTA